MNLAKIRRTAAEIAAAAVYELFPGVQLWGGRETRAGFSYDFFFPHPIHPELHFQIEERMRQIVREKREIRDLDMVSFSARELLKSQGHLARAEELEGEGGGLVRIVQIGPFTDLSCGDHGKNSSELTAFKLFPPILLEGRGMRVAGSAHASKGELKEFLKRWAVYPKKRHENAGERMKLWLFSEEGMVWLPEGLRLRERLILFLRERLFTDAFEISAPQGVDRRLLHGKIRAETGAQRIAEAVPYNGNFDPEAGLFEPREGMEMQITTSFENVISSLQSIGKTLNILGFNYHLRLIGFKRKEEGMQILSEALETLRWPCESSLLEGEPSRIDFLVEDGLGGVWNAASVAAEELLVSRVFVERNLALLLEQQESLAMRFLEKR